jgi:hypothetical protein
MHYIYTWQHYPEISRKTSGKRQSAASADNSTFKQGIGQLEVLMFVGTGVEDHERTRTQAFDLADRVLAKATPLIKAARVCEDVSPASSVDVKVDRLLTDRTLCEKRVKLPPHQQLYELRNPYR